MSIVAEISDERRLIDDATASIRSAEFFDQDGKEDAAEQAESINEVAKEPKEGVLWLLNPDAVVESDGMQVLESNSSIVRLEADGTPIYYGPNFAALFPVCRCGQDNCSKCTDFQITLRTASALHSACLHLADQAYGDVIGNGDDPVSGATLWRIFDKYPKITWRQDAIWRRQAARAYDDLAEDLSQGNRPLPRCPAEEMVLSQSLRMAEALVEDEILRLDAGTEDTEEHPDDYSWEIMLSALSQDSDILMLFDITLDGIEDPEAEVNQKIRMGDYRPSAWFRSFNNMDDRDPRRPFRR